MGVKSDEDTVGGLDLSRLFHTRISAEAKRKIAKVAQEAGIAPATWGRQVLYRELGIIKPAKARP